MRHVKAFSNYRRGMYEIEGIDGRRHLLSECKSKDKVVGDEITEKMYDDRTKDYSGAMLKD